MIHVKMPNAKAPTKLAMRMAPRLASSAGIPVATIWKWTGEGRGDGEERDHRAAK